MARDFKGARTSTLQAISEKAEGELVPVLLKISDLVENPDNEYLFGMENLDTLIEGIKENGFRGAIEVYMLGDGKYEVYAGHKRKRAKQIIGDLTIPCFVYPMPDNEVEKRQAFLYSNLAGRNAVVNDSPIYTARQIAYHRETLKMMNFKGEKRKELSRVFKISESQITKYEAILKLNRELQEQANANHIGLDNVSAISKLCEQKQHIISECIKEKLQREEECSNLIIDRMIRIIKEEGDNISSEKVFELLKKTENDKRLENKEKPNLTSRVQIMDNYKTYKRLSSSIEILFSKQHDYGEKKEEIVDNLKHISMLIEKELERLQ